MNANAVDFFRLRFIAQVDTATPRNLSTLPGTCVHETHQIIRLRLFPWNPLTTTVADHIIHEGLAESSAGACFGNDFLGHYVTDFDESEMNRAIEIVGGGLEQTGFDTLRAYIFGDHRAEGLGFPGVGMPAYGGYAVGYRVVQSFLKRTGLRIEEATFLPTGEIVSRSGMF